MPPSLPSPLPEDPLPDKALDLLVENLTESLKSADASVVLAFTASAFLLIPALEGAFEASPTAEPERLTLPALGLDATLYTGALFGMALFVAFCLRAAARVRRAHAIASRLRPAAPALLTAALTYPSVATASRASRMATCAALALVSALAWLLMYLPSRGFEEAAATSLLMAVPPAILARTLWPALAPSPAPAR